MINNYKFSQINVGRVPLFIEIASGVESSPVLPFPSSLPPSTPLETQLNGRSRFPLLLLLLVPTRVLSIMFSKYLQRIIVALPGIFGH